MSDLERFIEICRRIDIGELVLINRDGTPYGEDES